jgi:hypothetical protein
MGVDSLFPCTGMPDEAECSQENMKLFRTDLSIENVVLFLVKKMFKKS